MDTEVKPLFDLEISEGDVVECVKVFDYSKSVLTAGGLYNVVRHVSPPYRGRLGIFDDTGRARGRTNFTESTFKIVSSVANEEDPVHRPSHYADYEVEPVEFLLRNKVQGHTFNIVKYAMRAGRKLYPNKTADESEVLDLQKAIRYAEMRINLIQGKDVL